MGPTEPYPVGRHRVAKTFDFIGAPMMVFLTSSVDTGLKASRNCEINVRNDKGLTPLVHLQTVSIYG